MTTYNTGNPIGSTDARDLYDNAQNFDTAVNTSNPVWVDRFGVARQSLASAAGFVIDTPWLNDSDFATLAEADAAAVAANKRLAISTVWNIAAATTLTSAIKVLPGGGFSGSGTLTINGPFEAGLYQVFTGTNAVTFGANSCKEVYPEWWGTVDVPINNHDIKFTGTYNVTEENITNIESAKFGDFVQANNSIYNGCMQSDGGKCWLQHNHLEEGDNGSHQSITSGNIPPAPLYNGTKQSHTNVLAYWYQDFGLEATRAAGGSLGSLIWYYWSWMFHGAVGDGYEPERHPWLGYYRGDDPNVLDWQCYWLNEAGVSGTILQTRGDGAQYGAVRSTWANSSDANHWMYQLLNNVPNFKRMTYALWAWSASNTNDAATHTLMENAFTEVVAIYQQHPNFAYVEKDGKIYPIVFAFEGDYWRGAYDSYSGYTNTIAFLIAQAAKFQAAGWGGVCILARNSTSFFAGSKSTINTYHEQLEAGGVLYFDAEYSPAADYEPSYNGGLATPVDYEDLAVGAGVRPRGSTIPYRYTVPNIGTSAKSHSAHPSTWTTGGSTPELFELMCRNVITRMAQNDSPKILTIYNVSEWAEGGPSLQPNMRDGKGYLYALRNALDAVATKPITSTRNLYARQTNQTLSTPIVPVYVFESANILPLLITYAWTSTATPFINDPNKYDGKRIRIRIDSASTSSGPITISDETIVPGCKLKLTANTLQLGKNDSIELEYDATTGYWVQVGNIVNIL